MKKFFSGRRFKQGGISAALTAAFVTALVLLNLVVTALTERYQLRLDLTAEQVFVLTQQSRDFLQSLETDVSIFVLTPEQSLTADGDLYLIQANEVIKQYAAVSPRVSVEYIDLTRTPGFKNRYPQYQLNAQTILVESGGRVIPLILSDLFNIETEEFLGQYMEWISSSKAEQAMTGAIMGVTSARQINVSILYGFGEEDTAGLANLLRANRYEVTEQNILTGEIPSGTDVAVIFAPSRDYTEKALQSLDAFLENAGASGKSIIYFAGALQPETPNLDAFLEEWGISVDDGLIYQTDPNLLILTSNPLWSVVEYGEEIYSRTALERRLYVVMPEARPLTQLFSENGNKRAHTALYFGESVCVMPIDAAEGWTSAQSPRTGPTSAMIVCEDSAYAGEETVTSTVVAIASGVMAEDSVLAVPSFGNGEYLLSLFDSLTGREESIAITPKIVGESFLPITGFQVALFTVIFVALLPLAVLAAGTAVFFKRRNL